MQVMVTDGHLPYPFGQRIDRLTRNSQTFPEISLSSVFF